MSTTIEATYDGNVFRPAGPVSLPPNTLVRLTFEAAAAQPQSPVSFLKVAEGLALEGPEDWSLTFRERLYGGEGESGD